MTPAERWPLHWDAPWLEPWRSPGQRVLQDCSSGMPLAGALQAQVTGGAPFGFVDQAALPDGEAYEAFIARTRAIPTRDNPHDFLNGLVWLRFPRTKRRINQLQAAEIARRGIGATRGPLRDALTLFDESGAVLDAPPVLWQALLARDWRRLFVTERARWQEARLLLFGHALLDKLVSQQKTATAHVLIGPSATKSIAIDDAAISAALDPAHLQNKPFTPLPVLGVPGWCPENANFCFYDDSQIFRRLRDPEQAASHRRAATRTA